MVRPTHGGLEDVSFGFRCFLVTVTDTGHHAAHGKLRLVAVAVPRLFKNMGRLHWCYLPRDKRQGQRQRQRQRRETDRWRGRDKRHSQLCSPNFISDSSSRKSWSKYSGVVRVYNPWPIRTTKISRCLKDILFLGVLKVFPTTRRLNGHWALQ